MICKCCSHCIIKNVIIVLFNIIVYYYCIFHTDINLTRFRIKKFKKVRNASGTPTSEFRTSAELQIRIMENHKTRLWGVALWHNVYIRFRKNPLIGPKFKGGTRMRAHIHRQRGDVVKIPAPLRKKLG